MVAATFASAGVWMGDRMIPRNIANPKGYFEDSDINVLNDHLIVRALGGCTLHRLLRPFRHPVHNDRRAFWLAAPRFSLPIRPDAEERRSIRSVVSHQPFCLKDPRFSVTLPAWKPFLPTDTGRIVVFRDPRRMLDSVLRNAWERYDPRLPVDERWVVLSWVRTYSRLLHWAQDRNNWFFVSWESMLDGSAHGALEAFAQNTLDFNGIDPSVSRSKPHATAAVFSIAQVGDVYRRLQQRAATDRDRRG
jgi:hypothetical protein